MRNRIRRPNLEFLETQEKKHYESLISLFKYSLATFATFVALFSTYAGCSIREMKSNVDSIVVQSNKRIDEIELKSDKKLENIELKADKKLEEVMKRSELFLENSYRQTQFQVSIIQNEAKNNAIAAAKERVEHELERPQIQNFINSELSKGIDEQLDIIVDESVNKFSKKYIELTKNTIELHIAFQLSFNNRTDKIKFIDSISIYGFDKNLRKIALEYKKQIRENYTEIYFEGHGNSNIYAENFRRNNKSYSNYSDKELALKIIELIGTIKLKPAFLFTDYFMVLKQLTEGEIDLFDFEKLKTYQPK